MIIGDGHVQWGLQVDAVRRAAGGRSLPRWWRGFLRLQVRVGTLLQQLCSEAGQAAAAGCVQRGFSLNGRKWRTSERAQEGSARPGALTMACVPKPGSPGTVTVLGSSCHRLTMTRPTPVGLSLPSLCHQPLFL